MFLAKYTINNKEEFAIYYDTKDGWDTYYKDTFSPLTKDMTIIRLKLKGKTYKEKKQYAVELAKDYQYIFSGLSWSYGELAEIQGYFTKIAKKYGLIKEFRENGIC